MRLRIGNKPGVGPILKVMKYDEDDPFTTSSMDFDRFFFDSESQNLSYMYDFKSYGVMNKSVYPTGSYSMDGKPLNQTQWGLRSNYGPTQSYDYFFPMAFLGRMADLPYPPMVDARHIGSDGWVRAMSGYYPNSTGGPRAWTVMNSCVVANVQSGRTGVPEYRNIHNDYSYTGWCGRADSQGSTYSTITNPGENVTFAVWDLSSGEEEEPSPPLPVPGQKIITMSNARFAIAKPGYDVRTAQKRNLIMDSDKSPIKCIMYGETPMVYSGQTYFVPKTVDFDLDPTMHLEFFLKTQDSALFQIPPTSYATPGDGSRSVQFYYRIDPDGIRFRAEGAYGHAVKFVLFATGPAPFTTGGSRVVGKLPSGGFRIKRPGSSDVAPNYNDILLDTRLPTAYVVASEWVALSRFSGGDTRQFDIPIPDKNMFYYLKVMADFGDVRRHANYYVNVRLQYVNGWGNVAIYETSRQTFIVQDHGTFYRCLLYPNAPGDTNLSGPRGIRYHLLGITNRN